MDRHENSRWEFRQSRTDATGHTVRLYRSRSNPQVFKRVQKRTGSTSHEWEIVEYTIKGKVDDEGQLAWVKNLTNLERRVDQQIAQTNEVHANLRRAYQ